MVDHQPHRVSLTARAVILGVCLLAGAGAIARASKSEEVPPRESFATFPMEIGGWEGRTSERFTDQIMAVLGVDEYISRTYEMPGRGGVHLYVGFYASQRQGDTMHSPLNCLPGAGWEPTRRERLVIPVKTGTAPGAPTRSIEINRIIIERGLDRQMVLYWYQSHNRVVASEYWGKIYTVVDAVRLNRTDAAMIRVITPIAGTEPAAVAGAETLTREFVEAMFPLLNRYLPE